MRKIAIVLVSVIILCGVLGAIGCEERVYLNTDIGELSFSELWEIVLDDVDIQDQSANLESFHLYIGSDGSLESLQVGFHGRDASGRGGLYFVDVGPDGEVRYRSYDAQPIPARIHPLTLFDELDKYGLANLEIGDEGASIWVNFISGSIGYSIEYVDVYLLDDGELTPLSNILFHSSVPWAEISVWKHCASDYYVTDEGEIIEETPVEPQPPGERNGQIWFLHHDAVRAETLEYMTE